MNTIQEDVQCSSKKVRTKVGLLVFEYERLAMGSVWRGGLDPKDLKAIANLEAIFEACNRVLENK